MPGRTIWKGTIHFKDTSLPVNLHTAIKEERVQFHLLHRRDHVRLRQQMICAYEKQPVPEEAQVKGFEVEDGKYILVDPEELEQTASENSRVIEVHEFVRTGQIDPLFLDRAYRLEPDVDLAGYDALVAALHTLDVAGICTWTMRKRSYFGAVQASGKILRLTTLRYYDEVIPVAALELEKISLSEKELKIGSDLISQMTGTFAPQKYEDEHQKKLLRLIEKKARGEKIVILRPKRVKPTAPDKLLQALEESLKKKSA